MRKNFFKNMLNSTLTNQAIEHAKQVVNSKIKLKKKKLEPSPPNTLNHTLVKKITALNATNCNGKQHLQTTENHPLKTSSQRLDFKNIRQNLTVFNKKKIQQNIMYKISTLN